MDRSIALRALMACLFGVLSWGGVGDAFAEPLTCSTNVPTPEISVPEAVYVNRMTPLGAVANGGQYPGARLTCTGGTPGMPIELAFRVKPGLEAIANPFGQGLLLKTGVPGMGVILETPIPAMITSAFQTVWSGTRNSNVVQTLPNTQVKATIARHGDVDLQNNHAVHGFELMEMGWRSPGTTDWEWLTTWSLHSFSPGERNIITETCYIGPNASVPYEKQENLGSVAAGMMPNIGDEATGNAVASTVVLTCRNYAGGEMSVESTTTHPTMPGVLRNALTGPGAATGVGVRVRAGFGGTPWDFQNKWQISERGFRMNDTLIFDYNARFVKTDPTITPGNFKATVTFTVHYD